MRRTISVPLLALTALTIGRGSSLGAQTTFALDPCKLLTKADVKPVADPTMIPIDATGDITPLAGGMGAACTYAEWGAQLVIYSGPKADDAIENYLKNFKHDKDPRHDVSNVGDKAWVIFPAPRDQYEDRVAFLVVKQRQYTFGVSLAAANGKTQESVQPHVVTLAKAVIGRLP